MRYVLFALLIIIIFSLFYAALTNKQDREYFGTANKKCCIYAYFEKDANADSKCAENFQYFLENGIEDDVDYYFVINGEKCSVKIPDNVDNIKVFKRKNEGYDFGAYSYILTQIIKDNPYDYYFFMNTSVRGPFIKQNAKIKTKWTNLFIDKFNKDIKVVGTTINVSPVVDCYGHNLNDLYGHAPPHTHLQSMVFAIDKEYKDFLMNRGFFNEEEINTKDFNWVVAYKEFGLSQHALNHGWNINSVMSKFADKDYRKEKLGFNHTSHSGEPYCNGCYFGNTIDKYEAVFFKTNRELTLD